MKGVPVMVCRVEDVPVTVWVLKMVAVMVCRVEGVPVTV